MTVRRAIVVECDGARCDARLQTPLDTFEDEDEAAKWAAQARWLTFRTEAARLAYCPNCSPPRALYGNTASELRAR